MRRQGENAVQPITYALQLLHYLLLQPHHPALPRPAARSISRAQFPAECRCA